MKPDPRLDAMLGGVPGIASPALHVGGAASLASCVLQLDRSQWLPAAEIEHRQLAQLTRLAAHFERHDPRFAARLAHSGLTAADLGQRGGLSRLAPLTRRDVQAYDGLDKARAEAHLPQHHRPAMRTNTSGSTGEPVRVWKTTACQLLWQAITLRYHLWAEPDMSGRLAAIRANQKSYGERPNWGDSVSVLVPTGPALLVDIESDIAAQAAALRAFAADSVVIYPSNLAAILDLADADLPSVKRWRTLGETVSADLVERVRARGQYLIDCYSSEEIGYLALQCPDNPDTYHVTAENALLEVVDDAGQPCQSGEIGKVYVTDLVNHAMPMIRYAIGDYAEVGGPCPCGRGLPVIRRILGRERNMIVKPDGTRHWPLTGYKQFRDIAPIRQYQFRQHAPDHIEVRLVVERALTRAEETALIAHLHWKLHHPFRIEFVYFEGALPVGKNGKFEEFMSMV